MAENLSELGSNIEQFISEPTVGKTEEEMFENAAEGATRLIQENPEWQSYKTKEIMASLGEMEQREYGERCEKLANELIPLVLQAKKVVLDKLKAKIIDNQHSEEIYLKQIDKIEKSIELLKSGTRAYRNRQFDPLYYISDTVFYDPGSRPEKFSFPRLTLVVNGNTSAKPTYFNRSSAAPAVTIEIVHVDEAICSEVLNMLSKEQKELLGLIEIKQKTERAIDEYTRGKSILIEEGVDLDNPRIFKEQ